MGIAPVRSVPASWTGLSNYLLYDINDCWGVGLRYEYFEDLDGAVVTQGSVLRSRFPKRVPSGTT